MKLMMAIAVYLLIGLAVGWGILSMMHGSYWFLIASVLAYLIAFARLGCTEH
jgi:hypothetical protein